MSDKQTLRDFDTPTPEEDDRYCRECGCTLTPQEGVMCSVCYRHLTEEES